LNSQQELPDKRKNQKEFIGKIIAKPVEFFIKCHFTPNLLSLFGFLCSAISTVMIALNFIHDPLWLAWLVPFFLFIGGVFDVFDGEVARKTGKVSDAGAFLDSNLDRVSDIIIFIGLIYGELINFLHGFILMFLIIMISYSRAKAENLGLTMKGVGFLERAERLVLLTIALIAESWIYNLSKIFTGTPITWFFPVFIFIFTLLLIYTLGQRIYFSLVNLALHRNQSNL